MSRQRLAAGFISPLQIQQGLFASLALIVTLIGGQQYQRWTQAAEPLLQPTTHLSVQSHFSAVSSRPAEDMRLQLMSTEQVEAPADLPRQETWVF